MSVKIEMPKLSDTMTEGTLIKWHKKVGDDVEIGDILAEVETDKATMEMEAFDEGKLTAILIQEGEKAAIGSVLALLDGDDSGSTSAPAASTSTSIAGKRTRTSSRCTRSCVKSRGRTHKGDTTRQKNRIRPRR
jgi:pyruvate dehydrogenase E2 component (dihydrolipoamide acetyltransferase)